MNQFADNICRWSDSSYLLFSDNIWGSLVYYSHLLPAITILVLALIVFRHDPRGKPNIALLGIAVSFTLWSLIDLILWASGDPDQIMFFWSILIYFDLLVYVSTAYFVFAFVDNKWPSLWVELSILATFVPLFLFSHTPLNLVAFDYTNCWREALEGPLWQYYVYNIELLIAISIIGYVLYRYKKTTDRNRKYQLLLLTVGIMVLLFSFSAGNILGSFSVDWEYAQYGLFGMPIFAIVLSYLIVHYKAFNAKIITTQAIIIGLCILLVSMLFVQSIENVQIIVVFTLSLVVLLGYLLVQSVRREIQQREEIEKLMGGLSRANKRLQRLDKQKSEFVSIASHQLRSPLTAMRGYASMLLEGSFGKIPAKSRKPLEHIAESARLMALSIEDYLSVSRIESGNMKYDYSDFALPELAHHICDDLRPEAVRAGLLLLCKTDLNTDGTVHADKGKTQQILHNLINNAIKYTKKGTVTVFVHDSKKAKKIYVEVIDSGIGMDEDTQHSIFQKFHRAKDANSINVHGTGLGLYVARKMATEMGGGVTGYSDGPGKGSHFILELPVKH